MDTWLVRTLNLSDSLWARLRFRMVFYAPHWDKCGWFASTDGLNWHGTEWEGIGEECRFYCMWPDSRCGPSDAPPHKGVFFYLDSVPEIGDLTGLRDVRVGLRFSSHPLQVSSPQQNCPGFYGAYIDNLIVEHLPANRASSITTDPLSKWQWGLKNTGQSGGIAGYDVDAVRAWELLGTYPGIPMPEDPINPVVVAVLDDGVDLSHEDLQVLPGYDARYNPQSYYDETVDSRGEANPWDGHGTACAGIIGARKNFVGVAGVAPGVKILPVRIGSSPARAKGDVVFSSDAERADAVFWAVNHGARILSNSWGGA